MKKIALVGCGRISKRHIEAIKETPGVEIALVCDIIEERAKKTAAELNVPYVTDYRDIKDIDIVSVLTPSGNHPEHVAEIAESKAKCRSFLLILLIVTFSARGGCATRPPKTPGANAAFRALG